MIAAGSIRSTSASAGIAAKRFSANSDRTPCHGTATITASNARRVPSARTIASARLPSPSMRRTGVVQMHVDAVVGQPFAQAIVKDFAQRQARQHQFACPARGQKAVAEDLLGGGQRGPIDRFAQGADQHDGPESLDGPVGLALATEPLADGPLSLRERVRVRAGGRGIRD